MRGAVDRLYLGEFILRRLTDGFAAYLAYLLLAAHGGLDLRAGAALFLSWRDHEPPVDAASRRSFEVDREQLLRDAEVLKFVGRRAERATAAVTAG